MMFKKTLMTRELNLVITIVHTGEYDHMKINASPTAVKDFEELVDATMSYMNGRIKSWEAQHKERIEQVGR